MIRFSKYLLDGRRNKRLSQQEAADMAGIRKSELISLESGLYVPVSEEAIAQLAFVADADPDIMVKLYRSDFQQEIRERHAGENARDAGGSTAGLPELTGLEKSIMALSYDKRKIVISAVQVLLQAFNAA